jgi:hypothetical protein
MGRNTVSEGNPGDDIPSSAWMGKEVIGTDDRQFSQAPSIGLKLRSLGTIDET